MQPGWLVLSMRDAVLMESEGRKGTAEQGGSSLTRSRVEIFSTSEVEHHVDE